MVAFEQGETVHVMVELSAPLPPTTDRTPIDVVAVIDRSGSMDGEPLEAAKDAVGRLVRLLGADDRLTLVTYDDEVELVLGLKKHNDATASATIAEIHSGGSTNLAGGWLKAFEVLAAHGRPDATRTVLLLTDGLANVGVTDAAGLAKLSAGGRSSGIITSMIGLGTSFDEEVLGAMSDAGGGNDHYAASAEDLPAIFAAEFDDLAKVVAHNVSLELRPHESVELVEVLGTSNLVAIDGGVELSLGSAYGGEARRIVLALAVPGLEALGPVTIAELVLRYTTVDDAVALHTVTMPVVVNVVDPDDVANPDPEVTEEILVLRAAKAKLEARDLMNRGDTGAAADLLRSTAAQLAVACAAAPCAAWRPTWTILSRWPTTSASTTSPTCRRRSTTRPGRLGAGVGRIADRPAP